MATKDFPLAAVLTITTGKFLVGDIGEIYEILNWMTSDSLFTHQLPRGMDAAAPVILEQYPQLADIEVPDFTNVDDEAERKQLYAGWLEDQIQTFGNSFALEPLESFTHINPIEELEAMMSPDQELIVVKVEEP